MIDLRSDTATRPTDGMRRAIAEASVGDEQKREDPSVNALQERVAALLGHEAAIFVPTATMANQIALKLHSRPGDMLIAEQHAHVVIYEYGGAAAHAGLMTLGLPGDRGRLSPEQIRRAAEPSSKGDGSAGCRSSRSRTPTTLRVAASGRSATSAPQSPPRASSASPSTSTAPGFSTRRRLGVAASEIADRLTPRRSVSRRGSVVRWVRSWRAGRAEGCRVRGKPSSAARAPGWDRRGGGGLCAGHHVERLAEDHVRARTLAEALHGAGVPVDLEQVETNFVQIDLEPLGLEGPEALSRLQAAAVGLSTTPHAGVLRAVTHLDVTDEDIALAAERIPAALL